MLSHPLTRKLEIVLETTVTMPHFLMEWVLVKGSGTLFSCESKQLHLQQKRNSDVGATSGMIIYICLWGGRVTEDKPMMHWKKMLFHLLHSESMWSRKSFWDDVPCPHWRNTGISMSPFSPSHLIPKW